MRPREHIKLGYINKCNIQCNFLGCSQTRTTSELRSCCDNRGKPTMKIGRSLRCYNQASHRLHVMGLRKHIKCGDSVESVTAGDQLSEITREGRRIARNVA